MDNENNSHSIGFAGMSHLGMVSSICWASLGHTMLAIDADEEKITGLSNGQLPMHEPGLDDLMVKNQKSLDFSSDFSKLNNCQVVFISLDTETGEDNQSNLDKLLQLADNVIPHLQQNVRLFLMSQVPLGFTRELKKTIHTARPELDFTLFYWVETLVIGNAVQRFLQPERIIIGLEQKGSQENKDLDFIRQAFPCPVLEMSYESAELTKASINLYLSTSVTFANVLADLCEKSGASMNEIIPALRLDRRIGQYSYIKPSLGIAGGNLERDLIHLQKLGRKYQVDTGLIDTIVDYNAGRYRWVHRQLEEHVFVDCPHPTIAVWGLAYKKNTNSTKNSFAVRILHELAGKAKLITYDPMVPLPVDLQSQVEAGDRYSVLENADVLLVLTDWDEFRQTDFEKLAHNMPAKLIIDCVGVMDLSAAQRSEVSLVMVGDSYGR